MPGSFFFSSDLQKNYFLLVYVLDYESGQSVEIFVSYPLSAVCCGLASFDENDGHDAAFEWYYEPLQCWISENLPVTVA